MSSHLPQLPFKGLSPWQSVSYSSTCTFAGYVIGWPFGLDLWLFILKIVPRVTLAMHTKFEFSSLRHYLHKAKGYVFVSASLSFSLSTNQQDYFKTLKIDLHKKFMMVGLQIKNNNSPHVLGIIGSGSCFSRTLMDSYRYCLSTLARWSYQSFAALRRYALSLFAV